MKATKEYSNYYLCEGPVYMEELSSLIWVDIKGCSVHLFNYITEEKKEYILPDCVGAVVPYSKTVVVCCVGDSLCYLNLESGFIDKTIKVFDNIDLRFNDAKCDKYGNLWVGTMCRDFDKNNSKGRGSLYCIKDDVVVKEYKNLTIPNGMDWDGNYFYHIDTFDSIIYRYQVEEEINLTHKEIFIKMDALPDGMCLDENNNIWTALWGSGKVVCISTKNKKIIDEILIEESNASCVSFGNKDYKTIYISSGCDERILNGSLYKVESNYKGRKPNKYKR